MIGDIVAEIASNRYDNGVNAINGGIPEGDILGTDVGAALLITMGRGTLEAQYLDAIALPDNQKQAELKRLDHILAEIHGFLAGFDLVFQTPQLALLALRNIKKNCPKAVIDQSDDCVVTFDKTAAGGPQTSGNGPAVTNAGGGSANRLPTPPQRGGPGGPRQSSWLRRNLTWLLISAALGAGGVVGVFIYVRNRINAALAEGEREGVARTEATIAATVKTLEEITPEFPGPISLKGRLTWNGTIYKASIDLTSAVTDSNGNIIPIDSSSVQQVMLHPGSSTLDKITVQGTRPDGTRVTFESIGMASLEDTLFTGTVGESKAYAFSLKAKPR